MQTNELHEFTGRGHGDLVSVLRGYLGQWAAGGGSSLPPTLEGFPPFLHFSAAFGCHSAHVLCNTPSSVTCASALVIVSRAQEGILGHRLRLCLGTSSCMEDTLGCSAKAHPPLLADRRRRIVYCRGIPYGERHHACKESAPWQARNAQHGIHSASP